MVDFASVYNPLIQQNQSGSQNPLGQFGQIVGLQNELTKNKLLEGAVDLQKPQIDDTKLANARAHMDLMSQRVFAPLLTLGNNVTMGDVTNTVTKAIAMSKGTLTPADATTAISNLPAGGQPLHDALQRLHMATLNTKDQIDILRGNNTALNTGSRTDLLNYPAYGGAPTVQGSVKNTLSPEAAAAPQPGPPTRTGAPTSITTGERAENAGLAPPGTYTGNNSAGAPILITIDRSGRITKTPAATTPATPGTTGAPPASGGPMPTGVSPAEGIALKGSGDQFDAARANAGTYAQQMYQLQSALKGLQNTNTGPGTESRQAIESYLLALPGGVGRFLPGVDPKSVTAYDTANKYMTQNAQGQPNAARSDAALSTALKSSPSVHISNEAAQDIMRANIGFRRYEMSNYEAFRKTGADTGQWADWLAKRNQSTDPRAYSIDLIPASQRAAFMKSLSTTERTKFLGSVRQAINEGAVDPTALSSGGASGGQ